jgi:golgi apyrase
MDGFTGQSSDSTTYGFLDMGGASTQIAFEPSLEDRGKSQDLIDVRLRLLGGEEIHHEVFVTTWLGYGTNQARERYVGHAIKEYENGRAEGSLHRPPTEVEVVLDPCLPKNLTLTESPVYVESATAHTKQPHKLLGTGSFEQCLQKTLPLLNKDTPCPDAPCLFNGVHVPPINFSVSHFIGVSEYWYSSEHVFGLGGPYDFVQYERAASKFCSRDWGGIVKEHDDTRRQGKHSGDGEVFEGGQVVDVGKWGDKVELSRLEMQCFKAAWVANVLHDGIGMPRIVDPTGNDSTHGEEVAEQAKNKGLGRPAFQSVDTVGNIAISWTLGKMVLEASKEVPSSSKSDRPLVDPLDDIPESAHNPVRPIRPPFLDFDLIEDHISQHLPSSLSRQSLGFSPVVFMLYMILISVLLSLVYRLRRQLRTSFRRFRRGGRWRDRDVTEGYTMEEGVANGYMGNSRPPSPSTSFPNTLLRPLRRFMSSPRPRPHPISIASPKLVYRNTSPAHLSPVTGPSSPTQQYQNGMSRSSSPSNSYFEDGALPNSISSLSRSRNSSQMNLTTLVPRQIPMSRTNSALHVPNGPTFMDE